MKTMTTRDLNDLKDHLKTNTDQERSVHVAGGVECLRDQRDGAGPSGVAWSA